MSEQLEIRQRRRELLITLAYTVFSVLMIIVTTIENWPVFYIPLIACEIAFIWWSYISRFQTYMVRAFLVTAMTCLNIFLYGIQGENFYVLIPTLCVEFVLLSLYEITQVMSITIIQTALLFIYHLIFNYEVMAPSTTLEENRLLLQLLSLVVLIILCIYRIRHHVQEEDDFSDLEKRVRSEQRIKDDFMANTSHELRTPINTVSGMCEILLQKELPDEVHSSVLDIQMTGVELQNIVNDIMDYAALEADTMELSPRAYSITSTLNDVMNMSMFENRDKQLEIIFDCNPNIPRLLEGDEQQLRRVLNNLISNAIKFTTEGGVIITVDYRPEKYGINLIVSVRDTGVGIGLEEQETILRGFYQSDSDRNRKSAGMGLGLTISSALVKKMGGFLTVKSQLGKGSEFAFAIPQKVLDDKPSISLVRPAMIKLIWFYRSQSSIPTVRDSFVEHIKHFSEYFGIVSQQASSLSECKRRVSNAQGVHLIIGVNEYMEDKEYFDDLSSKLPIILIADRNEVPSTASQIHVLYKPYNAIMLAEIFNGRESLSPAKKRRQKNFSAPNAKILVVDDNLMNLKVVEGMLRKYSIKIVAASSGEEALNLIDSQDYDFVFMDHMMPGMDGVECFHHIREKNGTYFKQVPIVALTANAIAGSREMFLSEGFSDFIAKPIDSALLSEVLQRFIPEEKLLYDGEEPAAADETGSEDKLHEQTQEALADGNTTGQKEDGAGTSESEDEERRDLFEDLPGFDRETALMYCGTVDDFTELAEVYCDSGRKYVEDLNTAFTEIDLEKYALISHTIKSTSKTLGAIKLSNLALDQERAAKDDDKEAVKRLHDEFMDEYKSILDQLDGCLREDVDNEITDERSAPTGDDEVKDWADLKEELRGCLESFEAQALEDRVKEIGDKSLDGRPIKAVLSSVIEKAQAFDFEGAIDELDNIGGKA